MLMRKAMENVILRVEAVGDDIEILSVAGIVAAENGIGDMGGDLHKPRSPRVDKNRCVRSCS